MENMNRKNKVEIILKAWDYKSSEDTCNSVYLGSMEKASILRILGSSYGSNDVLKGLLADATNGQIDRVYKDIKYIISSMNKQPRKPGRPATGGRKRNKNLPALFTEEEVDEIRDGAKNKGETQADTVLAGVRLLKNGNVKIEKFIVKHYTGDKNPTIKGNGFDGLIIGDDREEAEEFIDFVNSKMRGEK